MGPDIIHYLPCGKHLRRLSVTVRQIFRVHPFLVGSDVDNKLRPCCREGIFCLLQIYGKLFQLRFGI